MNENTSETETKKIKRPGAGRTKGSFSFVKLTLAELESKLADKTTPIIVSRKWAEPLGFKVTSAAVNTLTDQIQGQTPNTKVAAKVTDLNDE